MGLRSLWVFVLLYPLLSLLVGEVTSNVVLVWNNASLSFDDVEGTFVPPIKGSGVCGFLHLAEPLDACSPLTNEVVPDEGGKASFALIIRGGCTFEDKIRIAQNAGFQAAIVFDNKDDGFLVAMAGHPSGIKIHAIFVSKASGQILKKYAGHLEKEVWIIPSSENSAYSIMVISFVSLLAMSALLATCFFVRRQQLRRGRPRASHVQEFHGMSNQLVKAMPTLTFTAVLEDNCTSTACAICLEDYLVGDKLRVLPCHHKFHDICVDSWLTKWRTFCPMCKRDARTSCGNPPASEDTPLLSSGVSSPSSFIGLSPARSSITASSAIQIVSSTFRHPSSQRHSFSGTHISRQSSPYTNSHALTVSRSFVDLQNRSSQRSHTSHPVSPHSPGLPLFSPLDSRYPSPYIPAAGHGSPGCMASSSEQPFLRHCSESAGSISTSDSAESLSGC